MNPLKSKIISKLYDMVDIKINDAKSAIASAVESRNNESKSSAGDKYETGREMMQAEIDNNQIQLAKALIQKQEIDKINIDQKFARVLPGCLVMTNQNNYFISIAAGKIIIDETSYYAISLASPMGMALKDKVKNDTFRFQDKDYIILDIL